MKHILSVAACASLLATSLGASAEPLERAPVETIAAYEVGAFLESVAVREDGRLLVADHTTHQIFLVSPSGESETFLHLPDGLAGVALDLDGAIFATSGYQETGGFVTLASPDGAVERVIPVPGSVFLNGAALLRAGVFRAADSALGRLYKIDTQSGEVSLWFEHPLLAPDPALPRYPGANGVKVQGGFVYVTNSGQALLLRAPITADGPGAPEVIARDVVLDDIAIAADGAVYGATHPNNSVVRIDADGAATTIATAEDGLTGATAVAFGRTQTDREQLYAVTNGGVYLPPETGVVEARMLRIDVGEGGLEPLAQLSHLAYPGRIAAHEACLVRCDTAPGDTSAIRARVGPAYLAFLEAQFGRIAFAGQFYRGAETAPSARYYFLSAPSAQSAQRLMQASPYFREGLYERCETGRFSGLIGGLLGGVAWPDQASDARAALGE